MSTIRLMAATWVGGAGRKCLIVAKHRNGPLGVVPLFFDQRTTRFQNLAPFQSPDGY